MIECRKVAYATKQAAKFRLKSIKARGLKTSKGKLRVYKCKDCDCYHLTSYDAKSIAKMKDRLYGEDEL